MWQLCCMHERRHDRSTGVGVAAVDSTTLLGPAAGKAASDSVVVGLPAPSSELVLFSHSVAPGDG